MRIDILSSWIIIFLNIDYIQSPRRNFSTGTSVVRSMVDMGVQHLGNAIEKNEGMDRCDEEGVVFVICP